MRSGRFSPEDSEAVDALVTDLYLDMVLAAGDRRVPGSHGVAQVLISSDVDGDVHDAGLRHAGDVHRAAHIRVHPSFRFEERLAARLAALAAKEGPDALGVDGVRRGEVIPFPGTPASATVDDPLLAAVLAGHLDPADEQAVARAVGVRSPARPLLVGGALTSAALSLVGVAWVAWRAARPSGSTMSRAAREAHARRLADLAELAASAHGGPA